MSVRRFTAIATLGVVVLGCPPREAPNATPAPSPPRVTREDIMPMSSPQPAEIRCPASSGQEGCHLIVTMSRAEGAVLESEPVPYPLIGIRATARALIWVDGISVANVHIGSKAGPKGAARAVPLVASVGDVRAIGTTDDALLVLTPGGLVAVGIDGSAPRIVDPEPSAWGLATNGHTAVLTTSSAGSEAGRVKQIDLATGKTTEIASNEARPTAITLDDRGTYWVRFGASDGAIRQKLAEQASPTTLASDQVAPRAIAVDGEAVYWTVDAADGRHVMRIPKRGGSATELAHRAAPQGTQGEERLVVEGGRAYFAAGGGLHEVGTNGDEARAIAQVAPSGRIVSFDVDRDHVYVAVEFPSTRSHKRGTP